MSVRWFGKDAAPPMDPVFVADITKLLGDSEYTWAVLLAFRTFDEQKALYEKHLAGGPLAAPPGRSAHEYGLAVDVCPYGEHGLTWDLKHPAWPWLWAAVKAHPRLHSGHDFPKGETDDDHVESTRWPEVREQLKAAGKW